MKTCFQSRSFGPAEGRSNPSRGTKHKHYELALVVYIAEIETAAQKLSPAQPLTTVNLYIQLLAMLARVASSELDTSSYSSNPVTPSNVVLGSCSEACDITQETAGA